jgi:malate synthase
MKRKLENPTENTKKKRKVDTIVEDTIVKDIQAINSKHEQAFLQRLDEELAKKLSKRCEQDEEYAKKLNKLYEQELEELQKDIVGDAEFARKLHEELNNIVEAVALEDDTDTRPPDSAYTDRLI